jgi:hypothetical protein
MGECYGTMHYLENNKERVKRTVAGMCIDSPAGMQNLAMTEYTWIMNPDSAKSYVDALTLRLAEEYFPSIGRPWRWMAHRSTTDNFLGDPSIGIPTVMPYGGYGVMAHHNSGDTPESVDPKSMRDIMVMNAAYAYFIAAAGPTEKRWMAELALTHSYRQMAATTEKILDQISVSKDTQTLGRILHNSQERLDYSLDRESKAVRSAWDLDEALAELNSYAQVQKARLRRSVRDRAAALNLGAVETITPTPNPRLKRSWCAARKWGRSRSTTCRATSGRTSPQHHSSVSPYQPCIGATASATSPKSSASRNSKWDRNNSTSSGISSFSKNTAYVEFVK